MFNRCDKKFPSNLYLEIDRGTLANDYHPGFEDTSEDGFPWADRWIDDHVLGVAGRRPRVALDARYTTTSTTPARWRGSSVRSRARDRRLAAVDRPRRGHGRTRRKQRAAIIIIDCYHYPGISLGDNGGVPAGSHCSQSRRMKG